MANEALALDDSMFLFLHDCSRRTDPFTSATVGAKLSIDYHLFLCCPAGERKKGSIGTEPAMPEFFFKEEREEDTDGYECWEHWQSIGTEPSVSSSRSSLKKSERKTPMATSAGSTGSCLPERKVKTINPRKATNNKILSTPFLRKEGVLILPTRNFFFRKVIGFRSVLIGQIHPQ